MKWLNYIRSRNIVPILVLFYAVGLAGMIVPQTRELFKLLTPFTLLLSTALLLVHHQNYSGRFWLTAVMIFLAGFFVEVIGVNTGVIFGDYSYGPTLGVKLLNTPLIIGVNWLMLVYCTLAIAGRYLENGYFRTVAAAAAMVVYDFVLEPSAIYFDMWNWAGQAVPLQNYIAWFAVALLFGFTANRMGMVHRENKLATPLVFIQMIFFVALDLFIYAEKIWA
ncbi:MAG: carotenoid biosynthesis protein [Bacteroidales bacterium]|nr:carotenoid biosynthesis protein [Bacteroidales bacterium]MBN2698804.1 carotenoid biosynthesis protein [Bacteroidales bacterium]